MKLSLRNFLKVSIHDSGFMKEASLNIEELLLQKANNRDEYYLEYMYIYSCNTKEADICFPLGR